MILKRYSARTSAGRALLLSALASAATLFGSGLSMLNGQTTIQFGGPPTAAQQQSKPAQSGFNFRSIPSMAAGTSEKPAPQQAQPTKLLPITPLKPGEDTFRILGDPKPAPQLKAQRNTFQPLGAPKATAEAKTKAETQATTKAISNGFKLNATEHQDNSASQSSQPATIAQVAFQEDALPGGATEPMGVLRPNETGGVQGLQGEVKIFIDPDTGQVTLIGDEADTALVAKAFEDLAKQTPKAAAERILLNNISSEEIAETVQEIYDANFAPTQGKAFVRALRSPNGLYVFGTSAAIESIRAIVEKVDSDAPPVDDIDGPFATFRLMHISAVDAKLRLDSYFGQLGNGGGDNQIPSDPVTTVADFRSNILIVRGGKQYLEQAEKLIRAIDVDDGGSVDVVRVFQLKNTLAEEIAPVLQDAVSGQQTNAGQGYNPNQNQQQTTQNGQADASTSTLKSGNLRLKTFNAAGGEISGGIMFDVRITADRNSNSLVVRGPESSMKLIGELIDQLDRLPDAETLIRVFAIENGDAQSMLDTLDALFNSDQTQQGLNNQTGSANSLPLQTASATQGASLVNLRFSIDERTNTIIATGPAGDLRVVEDLINRLDEAESDKRQTVVHRLSNSPVLDVQQAIETWLTARQDRNGDDPRTSPGVALAERDVDVIAEVVSNSLIISATPQYLPEIMQVIERLDRRPPMVKVKVLIAEVNLNSLEEFGVEVGVQDSLLFDRGTVTGAGNAITSGIGFPFNSTVNAGQNANAVNVFQETLAGQALTNFGTGRVSSGGQSGLVLSAGSESINVLIRALKTRNCLRVLSKPHIVTLENLQGRIAVGQRIPRITGSTQNGIGGGVSNSVEDVDVGVILEMTPRVSPDGMIVLFVNATKSSLDLGSPGVPVAVDANGNPVVQQPINSTTAQTTIMARSGQTVVFSGLIQETKSHSEAGVPILSDLPVIGPLFKLESDTATRSELMIILTPYLVDGDEEIEIQNQDEMERMHWCLCDVAEVYGKTEYNGYEYQDGAMETVYPDESFAPVEQQYMPAEDGMAPPAPADEYYEYGNPMSRAPQADQPKRELWNPIKRPVQQASATQNLNSRTNAVRQANFASEASNGARE